MIQPVGGQGQLFPVVVTRWQPFPIKTSAFLPPPRPPPCFAPGPCPGWTPIAQAQPAVVLLEEKVGRSYRLTCQTK